MSEATPEQTQPQPEPAAPQQSAQGPAEPQRQTFPLELVLRETGRTHTVTGAGVKPITDEDGNAEVEYALVTTIDGAEVVLASYNAGRIGSLVQAAKAAQQQQQS